MTDTSDTARRDRLRASGLRCTSARLAVLRKVEASTAPVTHAELVQELADSGIDQSTVYRNLIDLADAGLIRRRELGDHVWRFEPVSSDEAADHDHAHFLCVACGTVRCLPSVQLDVSGRDSAAAVGTVTEILVKGRCLGCDDES